MPSPSDRWSLRDGHSSPQVTHSRLEQLRIFLQEADGGIAVPAQESSYNASHVAVVYMEPGSLMAWIRLSTADLAKATLLDKHAVPLGQRDPVVIPVVLISFSSSNLFDVSLIATPLQFSNAVRIRLRPCNRAFAVLGTVVLNPARVAAQLWTPFAGPFERYPTARARDLARTLRQKLPLLPCSHPASVLKSEVRLPTLRTTCWQGAEVAFNVEPLLTITTDRSSHFLILARK